MLKRLGLLLLGLASALALAGALARAETSRPEVVTDANPYWSPDGRTLAFDRSSPAQDGTHVLFTPVVKGAERDIIGAGHVRGFRPDSGDLLVESGDHSVVRDPSDKQLASVPGVDASWSPDGARIAYIRDGTVYVAAASGADELAIAPGIERPVGDVTGPVWSPDGARVAYSSGAGLMAAAADGTGSESLYAGSETVDPSWSPDGKTIAFESKDGGHSTIWLAGSDGTDPHPLPAAPAGNSHFPAFDTTGRYLVFISDRGRPASGYALELHDLVQGTERKLADAVRPDAPPRWSPDGTQIAFAADQECRRSGVYVVPLAAPSAALRRSNQCRFDGTARADELRGTPYLDLMRGLGGNDYLVAGAGDDRIEGNDGNDRVAAGPGDDVVLGGAGGDVLSGGAGNDVIYGGPGKDLIGCGPGNDSVYVGAGDRTSACEHVHRS
ncbi:MAG: TolB protein [Gaiellaceae bacterium]|nr:TolB protein [Gaiellaceae bacterium]